MSTSILVLFFFYWSAAHRDLHSFPTRRSSDLVGEVVSRVARLALRPVCRETVARAREGSDQDGVVGVVLVSSVSPGHIDRKSTRLNSSHMSISYAVFCLKKKTRRDRSLTGSVM